MEDGKRVDGERGALRKGRAGFAVAKTEGRIGRES